MLFFGAIFLMIHSGNTRDDTNHMYALGVFEAQLEKCCEKKWFPKIGSPELLKLN
jgi:hypothetical protein